MKIHKMQRVIEVKEGWNFHGNTSEGRRRGSPIEGEAGRKPDGGAVSPWGDAAASPPFHRICVFLPQVGESTESQWARLIGGFSGKGFMALEEGMETILPMLPGILAPTGGAHDPGEGRKAFLCAGSLKKR